MTAAEKDGWELRRTNGLEGAAEGADDSGAGGQPFRRISVAAAPSSAPFMPCACGAPTNPKIITRLLTAREPMGVFVSLCHLLQALLRVFLFPHVDTQYFQFSHSYFFKICALVFRDY